MKQVKNLVLAAVQIGLLAWTGATFAADKVYLANEGANTVNVLDATSLEKVASVPVGKMPHNVQVSPDGKSVWVTNMGEPDKAAGTSAPMDMAKVKHDGKGKVGAVWVIDTSTNAVVAKVTVGVHPAHVVISPDGRFAYISNSGENTLSVIDTATRTQVAMIPVGKFPHGLRFSPDGKEVYVADLKGGTVSVIDTASQKEIAQVAVGKQPAQVGFTPDGRLAFVSLSGENAVAVIDPATRKVVRKVAVDTVPIQLYATADSRTLVVANQGSRDKPGNTASLIDLESFKVTKAVETGAGAHGVVIDREGRYAYVTNSFANSVSMLDVKERKVVKTVAVDKNPNGISMTP